LQKISWNLQTSEMLYIKMQKINWNLQYRFLMLSSLLLVYNWLLTLDCIVVSDDRHCICLSVTETLTTVKSHFTKIWWKNLFQKFIYGYQNFINFVTFIMFIVLILLGWLLLDVNVQVTCKLTIWWVNICSLF